MKGEPAFGKTQEKIDVIVALNFYNLNADEKCIREWSSQFASENLPDTEITGIRTSELRSIAFFHRMRKQGLTVTDEELEAMKEKFLVARKNADSRKNPEPQETIQEKLPRKTEPGCLVYFDEWLDKLIENKTTKLPIIIQEVEDVPVLMNAVEYYLEDLEKDIKAEPELKGYSKELHNRLKTRLNEYLNYLKLASAKIKRNEDKAPILLSKKKMKPAHIIAKNVKFLEEYENIKSIHPKMLVTASSAILIDTKTKCLYHLVAENKSGFTFTRSTIKNVDMEKSGRRRIQNIDETIKTLKKMTKPQMIEFYTKLDSPIHPPKASFTEDFFIIGF